MGAKVQRLAALLGLHESRPPHTVWGKNGQRVQSLVKRCAQAGMGAQAQRPAALLCIFRSARIAATTYCVGNKKEKKGAKPCE